ncbi:MAG TPA: hypothetical protein VHR41_03075 [Gemmatimonadales bacterium]|nr:hypothetical protein [Gemmatimonadales bacterium]
MSGRFSPIRPATLLLALLLGCGGDPTGPSTGSLAVQVSGLPAGTSADLVVTGPGGFNRPLAASQTLTALTPGTYTIAASSVSAGSTAFVATPASQSVAVSKSDTPSTASVSYGTASGALTVTVVGLPPGTAAAVTVSGPNGFSQSVTATQTLTGLAQGSYVVGAGPVSSGGAQYNGTPASQTVAVAGNTTSSAGVVYSTGAVGSLNLRIDGLYLTQSVQTYSGSVPLVKGRDGYLRVFVTANQINASRPTVRVRFFNSGLLTSTVTINAPSGSVPQSPDEGTLNSSWNIPVSGALIQPNLSILADVDPTNAIAESNETDNVFPASGTALALSVRTTPTFRVHLVPIKQSNGSVGNVTSANKDQFLTTTMKIHPLAAYDADVRGTPYTTSAPVVDANNTNNAWTTILSELSTLRNTDGSSRYYFGVLHPGYTSGVAGIGYVDGRAAMGWDYLPSAANVAAHEWGHNWGRNHAPCGGPTGVDPDYPYANAAIGVYGLDVTASTPTLKPPTATDVMGYCNNQWISDYTYLGVLDYLTTSPAVASASVQAAQPCLLVWGRIVDGRAVLEPAFEVLTHPRLPAGAGPYTVEGTDESGSRVFSLSFTPEQVADDPHGAQLFSFAIPLPSERVTRIASLRMAGEGRAAQTRRSYSMTRQMRSAPVSLEARRSAPGRVALRWDASRHPMVMVRDAKTGEVLSLARGGATEVFTDKSDLDLVLSNSVQSRQLRVVVPR